MNPPNAAAGEQVTITFSVAEELLADPVVTVNGNAAVFVSEAKNGNYTYEYTVEESDSFGIAEVAIRCSDLLGNVAVLSSSTMLEVIAATPTAPWWMVSVALLVLGVCALRARRTRRNNAVRVLLLGLIFCLASSVAFAQSPVVSNVTFTQGPNGPSGTQVDIYYDLAAPNGPCAIMLSLSKDGGTDGFIHPMTHYTGDIADVTTGTARHIVWDIAADYPNEDIPQARIRVTADDEIVQHTLTYTAGAGGSISGTTPQTVVHGADGASVTAVADPHYHFVQWSDGVLTATRQETSVVADNSITATFAIDTYTITTVVNGSGTCTASPNPVDHGSTSDITVTPAANWHVVSVVDSVDGSKSGSYTTSAVTSARTVTATFAIDTYTITTVVDGSGTCTASPNPVDHGSTSDITVTPASNWHVVSVVDTVDGSKSGSYTTSAVTSARTVTATFAANLVEMISVPAGTFDMGRTSAGDDATYGGPDELPVHSVTLGAYQIGKGEVTNKQYCDVLNWALAQGYLKTSGGAAWAGTGDIYAGGNLQIIVSITSTDCNIQYSGGVFSSKTRTGLPGTTSYSMDTHPVVQVSWYGSVAFCNWLSQMEGLTSCYDMTTGNWPLTTAPPTPGGYRLPTEAEWERAAAWDGSKHWIYGFTSDTLTGKNRANYYDAPSYVNPLGLTAYPYTSPDAWFDGVNVSPNGSVTTVNSEAQWAVLT